MLHINLICVGKIKEKYLKDAISEYSKRLSKYCILNIIELSHEKVPENLNASLQNIIIQKESDKILSSMKPNSYNIALDLKGIELSSEEFSDTLNKIALNYNSNITFIIGGTLGMSDKLLQSCDKLICFSKMTFPHQLIRVFLLEQLFRAFKIQNNETYHR